MSLSISASYGGSLTYSSLGLPGGLKINYSTGAISGTAAAGDAADGPYSVTVVAEDGTYSASTTFTWNVNSPVAIAIPADQTNNQGASVSLAISVSNTAGGTLSYSAADLPNGLTINSSTGAITGTVSYGGSWTPTITATNGTYSDAESFNWTVESFVLVADPGDQLNQIGDSVSLPVAAFDAAAGTLSFSASGLPTGLSINSSTGAITGTVGGGASTSTPYTTTVTVGDGTNAAVDTFTWTINPAGPVSIAYVAAQTNTAGDEVALPVGVNYTAGGTLFYAAAGLPAGLYINPVTGLIFGTVSASAVSGTAWSVTVTANDGTNSASQTFNWTVNAAGTVTLANPGDQFNNEGDTVSVTLSSADSGSGTLSYAAFGLPPGLKISPSTGAISGTVAVGDSASGPYTVIVTANDGTYSASQTFAWNVTDPVTITQPADQTSNEGDTASLSISGSDTAMGTLSYAAEGLPPGLKITPSTGAITGTVAVGDAASGPYSVTVIAADGTYSASTTFNWNVNTTITVATPFTQSNNDGDSVSLTVGAFDTPSAALTFSIQGLPPGLGINPSTGAITGSIAVGDSSFGSFYPILLVTDGTYTVVSSFEWDVAGAVSITDPGSQANIVGDTVTLPITASDTGAGTPYYAAAGLPAGLSINTSTGEVTGTVGSSAASIGDYSTTVTVSDGTNTASDTFDWTIGAASATLTLATPSNQSTAENASGSLSLSTTYSGGGTRHYFAEDLPPGLEINPSTGAISGTVAVGDSGYGPYTVTAIVTDGTISAEESFTWTITGPVTITQPADQTSAEGASVSLSLTDSDTSGGTPKFAAVGLPPGLQISTSTGAITGTIALDAAAVGQYSVTVTEGDGTYSASQSFIWTVNSPVTVTGVATQTNYEGDTPSLTITGTDASAGTLVYSAAGLPAGLSINKSTGAISGTIAAGASFVGPYSVAVTANDGTYSASTTFTWNVNNPIAITAGAVRDFSVGQAVSLALSATDAVTGTLSYAAFGLPLGLVINATTGLISGTISSAPSAVGLFASTIVVTDGTHSDEVVIAGAVLSLADGFGSVANLASQGGQIGTVLPGAGVAADHTALHIGLVSNRLLHLGERGNFAYGIGWAVGVNAGNQGGGVIIQHVRVTFDLYQLNGHPVPDASYKINKLPHSWDYYEAWPVQGSEVKDSRFVRDYLSGKNVQIDTKLAVDDGYVVGDIFKDISAGVITYSSVAYYLPNLPAKSLQPKYGFEYGNVEQAGGLLSVQADGDESKIANLFKDNEVAGWTPHVAQVWWGWTKKGPYSEVDKDGPNNERKQTHLAVDAVAADPLGVPAVSSEEVAKWIVDPHATMKGWVEDMTNYPRYIPLPYHRPG